MPEATTSTNLVEPIVHSVKSASYPDADVAATSLSPAVFSELHNALQQAKQEVQVQVRSLSKEVAPDVDGWITRANQVQRDIQESKATARSIVEAAKAQDALQRDTDDSAQKVTLLEKELAFSTALEDALKYIQSVAERLVVAKERVVASQIGDAFGLLSDTRNDLERLESSYSTNASRALASRASSINDAIVHSAKEHIRTCIRITSDESLIDVSAKDQRYGDASLEDCIDILTRTGSLETSTQSMRRDLERTFFDPWVASSTSDGLPRLEWNSKKAWLKHDSRSTNVIDTVGDAEGLIGFLSSTIPKQLLEPVVESILPHFWEKLQDNRLNASVPVDVDQLGSFDELLTAVSRLSRTISATQWSGQAKVQDWLSDAPRVWLSRQREYTLQQVRNVLLSKLRQRKEAEKVETQIVDNAEGQIEEDAWDTEWTDEQDIAKSTEHKAAHTDGDDDDASAWDMDGDSPTKANGATNRLDGDTEDEAAWGWGEGHDDSPAKSKLEPSPQKGSKSIKKGSEVTLRETYTVTGVPDALFAECSKVLVKAKQLSGEHFSSSAIGPGINGMSNIPTLATALYRAMALTAYDKIANGKMLLYNDSKRMADLLQALIDGDTGTRPDIELTAPLTRKLTQDVKNFELCAKVSYAAEMESQKTIIRDLMDGAQGFSNCTTQPYAAECDNAVEGTIERIRTVYDQWSDILSKSALKQATGSLLGTATSKFMVDIQELSDIGEVESKQLLGYVKSISSLGKLFEEQNAETKEIRDMTPLYCPNWLKLQYFGEILDGSLADIKYLWTEGELSLEFQAEEVVDLIEALFADSDHRRKAISEIRNSQG
ncbi:Hypothetical protein D9617_10g073510 [Elsinoe fawcettii]|nr:Hypothetical protein D9617_10g073510 [Elsinoe fawcettii]